MLDNFVQNPSKFLTVVNMMAQRSDILPKFSTIPNGFRNGSEKSSAAGHNARLSCAHQSVCDLDVALLSMTFGVCCKASNQLCPHRVTQHQDDMEKGIVLDISTDSNNI